MDTARCKAFVASVKTGSFSKAAEELNYTTSGVSQLVTALEEDLNLLLFRRSRKGVTLTVDGHPAPIIGRVYMDQLMVDVTGLPDVSIGDRVVVFGTAPALSAQELAQKNGTIAYEIVCAVGERVPRLYLRDDRVVDVLDRIVEWL